ncbi:pimeloyl-ACP methyl ester carboxylesterase [Nocardia transvalensis]|uniref:Pimeloyl-ACP methyl ester carboxylesterase n=1 Tax=Nocardia transvalensis TaxID=37333 RepID=A0A7W9PL37_9NOCA|nr:alpha/beta hydrolase [Nocardia transvalensis]MBB5918036.1 pimeloyl-ACP methyl ester carboxylesterase [Nocardia transvalensis]
MTIEESTFPLDDGDMYVRQDGPRDAPALLLIHGSAASARSWDALVPLLTESHRVVRIDLLGCGRSAEPADGSYAVEDQARRVGNVLDRLDIDNTVIAGHSSGGMVATALAARNPALVSALVLIDTAPSVDAAIPQSITIDPSQWDNLTDDQLRPAIAAGFAEGFEIPRQFLDELRGMTIHSFLKATRAATDYLAHQPLPDRLATLDTPLLVLFGEKDQRVRPTSAARYRAVPGARIEMLPGSGHSPIIENPSHTAALLLPFAASHTARPENWRLARDDSV